MKVINFQLTEVSWKDALMLNEFDNLKDLKGTAEMTFEYLTEYGYSKRKPLRVHYKQMYQEMKSFYALEKSLGYKLDVVFSEKFIAFSNQHDSFKNWRFDNPLKPNTPYKITGMDEEVDPIFIQGELFEILLSQFEGLYPEVNPYQIIPNKASLCDFLIKVIKKHRGDFTFFKKKLSNFLK